MERRVPNQLSLLSSGNSTGQINPVSISQSKTVDIEGNELTKHIRIIVQVPRIPQHCSLRHDAVEQRPFVAEPDEVLDSVAGFKVESVELETGEAEDVSVCHDALC